MGSPRFNDDEIVVAALTDRAHQVRLGDVEVVRRETVPAATAQAAFRDADVDSVQDDVVLGGITHLLTHATKNIH
jgi:hypothetical protein